MACDWVGVMADLAGITAFIFLVRILPFLHKLSLHKAHTDEATVHEPGYKIKRKKSLMPQPAASTQADPSRQDFILALPGVERPQADLFRDRNGKGPLFISRMQNRLFRRFFLNIAQESMQTVIFES